MKRLGKMKNHRMEKALLFHLEFECIHTFIDGNGRTGRLLLLNILLMQKEYPPIDVKLADRKQYYDCFDAYSKNDTAEPMVRLVGGYLEKRLAQMVQMLREEKAPDSRT